MGIAAAAVPVARFVGQAVVKAAPQIQQQAVKYIQKATGGRVKDVQSAVQYATLSKNNLAVVAVNAARAGIPPEDLLPALVVAEAKDRELKVLRTKLETAFKSALATVDSKSVIVDDGTDTTLIMDIGLINKVADLLGIRSEQGLATAHTTLRLWLAMSEDAHAKALATRRVARG